MNQKMENSLDRLRFMLIGKSTQ